MRTPAGSHPTVRRPRWRRALTLTALAVTTPLLAVGCADDGTGTDADPLAAVEVTGPDGTTVSTTDWVGEPLVINFWYSTCPPCAKELADFAEVDDERDDVRFVGVNPLDSIDDMVAFAADRGVDYDLFRDEVAELQTELGIVAFPSTVFVDADGNVIETTGVLDADELRDHIDDLVAGAEPADDDPGDDSGTADPFGNDGWNGIVRDPLPQVDAAELPIVGAPDGPEPDPATLGFAADPGEVRVVYFGFTACPDVCPTTMADLAVALRILGDDADRVDTVMVSVDPERDRDTVHRYVNAFVPGSTGLLTDDADLLQAAGDPFGASWDVRHLDDGTVEVDHTAFLYAVDDQGRLAVSWQFGTPSDLIAADLTRLLEQGPTT